MLPYLLCNASHFRLNFKSNVMMTRLVVRAGANLHVVDTGLMHGSNLKFNFVIPAFLESHLFGWHSRSNAKPIYLLILCNITALSGLSKLHIEQKKGWNYTFSHRFINYGAFPFHASSTHRVMCASSEFQMAFRIFQFFTARNPCVLLPMCLLTVMKIYHLEN